ncbi:hypothetical protein [Neobacillus niacini]|uniref:hypothetical protein n=1 Tax=Neobacillus niacini TaxID=86668 RepID=UPI0020406FCB|nr:hypothetical protein [Neobacillus niacini]MCM3691246.1 hypothetical protein [Neobacillus niacini]
MEKNSKIEQAMANALASLQVEGLKLTEEEIQNVREKLMGKITHEEFLQRAHELANRAGNGKAE